jgi:hypothetical protein
VFKRPKMIVPPKRRLFSQYGLSMRLQAIPRIAIAVARNR